MRKYTIGDYFVLRSIDDLKLAAKKLEDEGYQVYANGSQAAREHVKYAVNQAIIGHGFAVLGIDQDRDVIVGSPNVVKGKYARLTFADARPNMRTIVG